MRFEVVDRQRFQHAAVLTLLLLAVTPLFAGSRHVIFVDSARAGGAGTYDKPFATIAEASRMSGPESVIFVAQAPTTYEEGVSLKRGQMLVGSAYGLDALRAEMNLEFDAPPLPAATGTGPVIHGMVSLAGDNLVAGCTIIADRKTGVALAADTPEGPITIRKTYVRTAADAWALYVNADLSPITWTGGAIDATDHGSGILINSGNGDVTLDHVAISGAFGDGIAVRNRSGGTITFRNAPIKIRDASRDAVALSLSKGTIAFDSPLQIKTTGGRGLLAIDVQNLRVPAASIDTTDATALTINNSNVEMELDHVSADGRLKDGIVIENSRGHVAINGGFVRDAASYGIRVTQSANVRISSMSIFGGGGAASTDDCPQDVIAKTNVRCRAAVYLRHVAQSSFENITIEGNGGVGLNANNLVDTNFADIKVGHTAGPALLVDEARGNITFARCTFSDVVVAQQYNNAKVTFDRCDVTAMELIASEEGKLCVDPGSDPKPSIHITGSNVKVGDCNE